MVERGILGNKTKGGFYKKQKGEGDKQEIWTLDTASLEYRPSQKVKLPALDMAKNIEDTPERIKTLVWGKDRVGAFLLEDDVAHACAMPPNRIPEIADTVVEVDRAMRWGFNWELGPFEVWDAIGVEKSVARMKEEGQTVPANVRRCSTRAPRSFYKKENGQQFYFDFASGQYVPLADPPGVIILKSVKDRTGVIKKNSGASLIDLGDGVACLEFHSKMNAIGGDTLQMLKQSLAEVEKNFVGLVVGNQGANFCVGANLMLMLMEAQEENWEELDMMARVFQDVDDESALFAEAGRRRAVSDGLWRRLRDGAARRSRARGGGNLHRTGGSRRRNYSCRRRHERDAGARARLDSEGRGRRRPVSVCEARV